jgi:hypothetical protein
MESFGREKEVKRSPGEEAGDSGYRVQREDMRMDTRDLLMHYPPNTYICQARPPLIQTVTLLSC